MHRRTSTTTRTRALGGFLVLVLLLSSCIKYEGTITIEDDGSGTVDILTAVDPSAFGAFADLGEFGDDLGGEFSTDEICSGLEQDLSFPADAQIEPYNEDGFCGSRARYSLVASNDHSAELGDALDETTRLFKDGDNWIFESDFNTDDITGEAEGFGGEELLGDLFDDASFVLTVDLPGRAIEGQNNATQVGNDGRFTWDIDILNPPARLFAQTEPGSGGGTGGGGGGISKILISVVVLALLGAGAFFFLKKKNDGDPTPGSAFEPGPVATPGMAAAPGAVGASLPTLGGPPIAATPPVSAGAPFNPAQPAPTSADAMKETVVLSAAEAQQFARDAVADPAGAGNAVAAAAPQPVYDEALGAWVVDDPARGRLRHDPATDTWTVV